jgi:RecJ-like exonuclease
MSNHHTVVYVNGLVRPVLAEAEYSMRTESPADNAIDIYDGDTTENEEEDSLISSAECRICQDECDIKNLESPCACNGSLKYAHRKCVQRWCNEKGNTICEICHQVYTFFLLILMMYDL